MSHMIDTSNSRENIAFVNEVPWHGLGQQLTADADLATWAREAGLSFDVKRAPVQFQREGVEGTSVFTGRDTLYRSDTGAALGIVGGDYRTVQPSKVLGFFSDLVSSHGFSMEVAGSLAGGRRIWALARCGEGAEVIGQDEVRPYLLLATSYDGGMSTTAKFTAVRVVCNNTMTMSTGVDAAGQNRGATESDTTEGPVVSCVRIPHSQDFDADKVKLDLGIVRNAFDRFVIESRLLAHKAVDEAFVIEFLKALLPAPKDEATNIEAGRTFKRLLATWRGDVPSATLPEAAGTAWSLLNAITWDVDHVRGNDATRLGSAWFGNGEGLKNKARDLLVKVAA
jgi:phage/plasmid-like protein (TIGR03299 family)